MTQGLPCPSVFAAPQALRITRTGCLRGLGLLLNLVHSRNADTLSKSAFCEDVQGWLRFECPHETQAYVPVRCRHCRGCREARRRRVVARIAHGIDHFGAGTLGFLTLTSKPGVDWPLMMRSWQSLLKQLRRWNGDLEYAAVKQVGSKGGMRHLHIVLANWSYTPWEYMARAWDRMVGARGVDIRRLTYGGQDLAGYIARYVGRDGPDVGVHKVVTYSKGWPKLPSLNPTYFRGWVHELPDGGVVHLDTQVCIADNSTLAGYDCLCFGSGVDYDYYGLGSDGGLEKFEPD